MRVATKSEVRWTQNVVASWPGSDPVLKSEYVAFGAHYDHVGVSGYFAMTALSALGLTLVLPLANEKRA